MSNEREKLVEAIARMDECRAGCDAGDPFYADAQAWDVIRQSASLLAAAPSPPADAGRGGLVPLSDYRALYQAYVALLESGRDRIKDLGGTCDPVDVMERGDIALRRARDVIADAQSQQQAAKAAAPAPALKCAWIDAVDHELVNAHIGVADAADTFEVASRKLDELIRWHVAVATDPAVNGGLKLTPVAAPAPGVGEAVARLDARDLFDPARLPDRDAEGYLSHPDLARVLFVEDETDVTPFFNAAGLELVAAHYDWPDHGDEDDGISLNWLTPDVPAGDGWRLAHIGDTEDGSALVWWCRFVGQRAALEAHTAPPAPHGDGPDATLLKFYGVDGYPALVGALEAHVLQLIDTHKRNVKLWEDTFPPTLLPKWIREKEQKALVLAGKWQDEAAESWGETAEHATLQRCADELRAAIAAQAGEVRNG